MMPNRLPLFAVLLSGFLVAVPSANAVADEPAVDFNRQIRPVLADTCFKCHGPDAGARKANLRLDRKDGLFSRREGGIPVVPGKPDKSELYRRITAKNEFVRMPPPDSNLNLTAKQIELIRRWIEQGAEWEQHWAFTPVRRPDIPRVENHQWVRNPIDRFVLARLEQEGLSPSPEASKETLIRRVTLDLTGLPPTPAEVDAFLADTSPNAYEKLVDRLLSSPRYGEHMARMWLDAARYADTDGYQNDGPRSMWRWRDWVIDAYNANKPFDEFTVEQLAGDLLPSSHQTSSGPPVTTSERLTWAKLGTPQQIATGFNRNHRYNSEAGLVLEEFLLENAVDRVDTTSTVWMGLTMGCARCHDHKFDSFSQKEYYQLIAYFDKVTESGRAVKFGNSEPWVVAATQDQKRRLAELDRRVEVAAAALQKADANITAALRTWERNRKTNETQKPAPVISRGLAQRFPLDGETSKHRVEKGQPDFTPGAVGDAVALDGRSVLALGKAGDVYDHKRSSIAFWLKPEDVERRVILSRQTPNTRRPGVAVKLHDGHLRFFIIARWVSGVAAVETVKPLAPGQWVHVTLTNDGSQSARGMHIFLNGQPAETRILYNTNSNTGGTRSNAVLRLGGGVHGSLFKGQVDELRFYNRTLWDDEIALLAVRDTIDDIAAKPPAKRTTAERNKLRTWFLEHAAPKGLRQLFNRHFAARTTRLKFSDSLPTAMVMEEDPNAPPTHVRIRGVYNRKGDKVQPGTPAVLPPMPADYPDNRLGFAKWLVNGKHPLTARVAVNRYWQKYFGTGLVKTAEDFGVQGERPSHPQLLDWLASEFVRTGWNIKAMQKLIVTSATYRQSSRVKARRSHPAGPHRAQPMDLLKRDPENRLLARGPRRRLSAHAIRDQALAVSGLLTERIGGPSVSPYQPPNLWRELSNMRYRQSKGADLYRRSLYTIWKRTIPPPSMTVLDAVNRETCWVRTKRTNTPLQALTLLNEKTYVEAARNLGVRMIREGGDDPVSIAFRLVTARRPKPAERKLLERAYREYLAEFRRHPAAAKKIINIGNSKPPQDVDEIELAANTVLANMLLNLDEVMTKE